MKSVIVLLLLFCLFHHAYAQQPSAEERAAAEKSMHLDSVFKSFGKQTTFRGQIYEYNVLGDTVLVLTCGEIKRTDQSLLVVVKDKKIATSPQHDMLLGKTIRVTGILNYYTGKPAMIVDGGPSSAKVAVLPPLQKGATMFY